TPPPPLGLPGRETAGNICARPPAHWSPVPPAASCLLLPTPSCNKISGEDLRQRGSSRASFRACASSTYSTLGGTPFFVSLHLSAAKDLCNWLGVHRSFAAKNAAQDDTAFWEQK